MEYNFQKSPIKEAFIDSIPAMTGYIPIGLSFGIVCQKLSYPWFIAPLISLFIYAGASQFILVSMLIANSSFWSIVYLTAIVNLRHVFYGFSFLDKFKTNVLLKTYMVSALTDESYALLANNPKAYNNTYSFYISFLSHFYWVFGTFLGVYCYSLMGHFDTEFLVYALTALFLIMALDGLISSKYYMSVILGTICFFISFFCFKRNLLLAVVLYFIFMLIYEWYKIYGKKHVIN
ncbi:AzlC family ABC transporter permease [Pigmentibacter sp. JX0631]|uniref:AzlC family ABC transporter permease n=1 Tax=Pigmentibacter sp. JX0631 TaxID=2976982 RepID=UPI002469BF2B|nr:AzlC family ABC transporter permease [Pigmentibacter sp. JX0631]WGL60444.1 AzlC family ABC transporter permease [Pigmentibacter sp. JX0631]